MSADAGATLELRPAGLTSSPGDYEGTPDSESLFLDYVVNGVSLRVYDPSEDIVTELNRAWLDSVPLTVERLLGRRRDDELAVGRVRLLVCRFDADLGCGSLTASLNVTETVVTWSQFQWEDGFRPARPVAGLNGSFTFSRGAYEQAFAGAYDRVAAFPYEERARQRRAFWPWEWGWRLPR